MNVIFEFSLRRFRLFLYHEGVVDELHQLLGHLLHREDDIGQACVDDAPGHTWILGLLFLLDHDHSPFALDRLGPQGAVVTGP